MSLSLPGAGIGKILFGEVSISRKIMVIANPSTTANVYTDFDITSSVQEVVNRVGYATNNPFLCFVLSQATTTGLRSSIYTYEGSTSNCVELEIETSSGSVAFTPKVYWFG